jgi:putative FmdB family regulatory protein
MTYEYVCEACGHQWEAEQSIKDSALKTCVSCGENKAKRLVSGGTGFLLKGGGWYADLYGSPGSGGAKAGDSGKSGGSSAKAESSDSKPSGDAKPAAESKPSGDTKASSGSAAASTTTPAASPASSAKAS